MDLIGALVFGFCFGFAAAMLAIEAIDKEVEGERSASMRGPLAAKAGDDKQSQGSRVPGDSGEEAGHRSGAEVKGGCERAVVSGKPR